ncbi:leucine-rich repeat-containing protein [Novymonas esmeraldas]|uniref:Leucine-rich repeat-containing protein n=1 Tax=Novymonas esmeraldas TaxID=1808958 RepID=A0AAW0F7K3_9TRYP
MGCDVSSLKAKKESGAKADGADAVGGAHRSGAAAAGESASAQRRSNSKGSLEIPVPDGDDSPQRRSATDHAREPRSASANHYATKDEPSPNCPAELRTIIDNMSEFSTVGTSSSAPQLFRVSATERATVEPGTWAWWRQELRHERVTKDGYHRVLLEDIPTRLSTQHEDDPSTVELDLSCCFMERTAPYVLGRLFASPQLKELRWVTSLQLDGNYFTDDGFGTMLATMSAMNEEQTVLPVLRQLYLNNMNLDRHSVAGLFAYLFPVDRKATRSIPSEEAFRIAGSRAARPPESFIAANKRGPTVSLFPSLTVLSLSDNPGLGTAGLIQILRSLLAVHYEPHIISVMDLSRCGMDRAASRYLQEYFTQLPRAANAGCHPVVPRRLVLMGNQHGIADPHEVHTPANTGVQLVL